MTRIVLFIIISFLGLNSFAQKNSKFNNSYYVNPELQFGISVPFDINSPIQDIQKTLNINISKKNYFSDKKWASLLNFPTTGIMLSYTNFANESNLNTALSFAPFIEYNFRKNNINSRWYLKSGYGVSYFNKVHNPLVNPEDKAIVTHFNITYSLFLYYQLSQNNRIPIKLGGGYTHHSNGHIKLPNLGMNSAIFSVSSDIPFSNSKPDIAENVDPISRSYQTFLEVKTGLGYQDFLINEHDKKNVIALSSTIGTIYKDTYKVGVGVAYRKYQHYYDYIIENQPEEFKEKPNLYASNFLLFLSTEVLLDHVGLNIDGGINLYKPFYETHYIIQWKDRNFQYKLKKLFMGRMGLKFYVNNTEKLPTNNLFIGGHINANLSQADFFEYSIGYIYRFRSKRPSLRFAGLKI